MINQKSTVFLTDTSLALPVPYILCKVPMQVILAQPQVHLYFYFSISINLI